MTDNLARSLRLMLVTDDDLLRGRDVVEVVSRAVRGGGTSVQLRLKRVGARELLGLARRLRERLGVPVLVNDRPDVAAAAGCGVHLGPDDVPLVVARSVLGRGGIIGASVGTPDEAPGGSGADYWGVGPWRVTGTKSDAGAAIGAEGFRRIVALAGGRPCVAIGSVRPDDVSAAVAAGAAGVAVASGILAADDVEAAAHRYLTEWEKAAGR